MSLKTRLTISETPDVSLSKKKSNISTMWLPELVSGRHISLKKIMQQVQVVPVGNVVDHKIALHVWLLWKHQSAFSVVNVVHMVPRCRVHVLLACR